MEPQSNADERSEHKCSRCGLCCQQGTIWVNSQHPLIQRIVKVLYGYGALSDGFFRNDGPCDMLVVRDGAATCLIEKYLGFECKPDACQDYPGEDKCVGQDNGGEQEESITETTEDTER
ncbi:hypothetical protein M0R72_14570 [Candidatus Pacearchaeota archaeon]|nr:hypothetical protein [Candidatus Pacearchaeota archaeon]